MNKIFSLSFSLFALISVSGCSHKTPVINYEPTTFGWIQSTQPASPMTGKASFWSSPEGVKIRVVVTSATPGIHAVHIHENGDCSDSGNAAGGHFNPDKTNHGNVVTDGMKHAHPGDLGNIKVDSTGLGSIEVFVENLSLDHGKYGIAGRSVVVHEKADDFGQPTGNAGGREGCAVIPSLTQQTTAPTKAIANTTTPSATETSPKPARKRSPWFLWLY